MEVQETLHDFYPLKSFKRFIKSLEILWVIIFILQIIFYLTDTFSISTYNWLFWTLVIFLFISFWGILFVLSTGKIATNWDDMDYNGLIKRDFEFIARDGKKLFAYVYFRKGLDTQNDDKNYPTIISFHGWGSHHREMDRYCLPTVINTECLYFTFDSVGQGQTPGDKNDFRQFEDCKDFIQRVRSVSKVDPKRIVVVGMSMGAAKAAYAAYPNPNIKAVVMLSGPYDFIATVDNMTFVQKILFFLSRSNLNQPRKKLIEYSGITHFKNEGIILKDDSEPTPNEKRVFLAANKDDPVVNWVSTKKAIEILNLPPKNYRIFKKGKHCFESGEYYLSVDLFNFLTNQLFN